jgi:hypothetical protein
LDIDLLIACFILTNHGQITDNRQRMTPGCQGSVFTGDAYGTELAFRRHTAEGLPCGDVSYKRPQHVEIWPAGKDFPITRSTKVDKLALKDAAKSIIEDLRRQGKWDAN